MIKGIIFDFNRTIYDPCTDSLTEGCLKVLDALGDKECRLCLLSVKTRPDREEQIDRLRLKPYFKKILIINEEEQKNEGHFQECLDAMSLTPQEVAVVGDRIEEEICVGKKMGLTTIWYNPSSKELPQNLPKPDHEIDKLEKVLDLVS